MENHIQNAKHMIINLSNDRQARIQSIDIDGSSITFQLLDSEGNPINTAGQHGPINPEVITFPVEEALIAGAIEAIIDGVPEGGE